MTLAEESSYFDLKQKPTLSLSNRSGGGEGGGGLLTDAPSIGVKRSKSPDRTLVFTPPHGDDMLAYYSRIHEIVFAKFFNGNFIGG